MNHLIVKYETELLEGLKKICEFYRENGAQHNRKSKHPGWVNGGAKGIGDGKVVIHLQSTQRVDDTDLMITFPIERNDYWLDDGTFWPDFRDFRDEYLAKNYPEIGSRYLTHK